MSNKLRFKVTPSYNTENAIHVVLERRILWLWITEERDVIFNAGEAAVASQKVEQLKQKLMDAYRERQAYEALMGTHPVS